MVTRKRKIYKKIGSFWNVGMKKIGLTEKITNAEVLRRTVERRTLV